MRMNMTEILVTEIDEMTCTFFRQLENDGHMVTLAKGEPNESDLSSYAETEIFGFHQYKGPFKLIESMPR